MKKKVEISELARLDVKHAIYENYFKKDSLLERLEYTDTEDLIQEYTRVLDTLTMLNLITNETYNLYMEDLRDLLIYEVDLLILENRKGFDER